MPSTEEVEVGGLWSWCEVMAAGVSVGSQVAEKWMASKYSFKVESSGFAGA